MLLPLLLPLVAVAPLVVLIGLARHRTPEPAGHPLGDLGRRLAGGPGVWDVPRDDPAPAPWPGGRRPPLRDNLPKETPR